MSGKSKRGIGYGKRRIKNRKLLAGLGLTAISGLLLSNTVSADVITCPQAGVIQQTNGGLLTYQSGESYCSNVVVGGSAIWTTGFSFESDDEFTLTIDVGPGLIGNLFVYISSGPSATGVVFDFEVLSAGDIVTVAIDGGYFATPSNPTEAWVSFYAPDMPAFSTIETTSAVPIPAAVWLFGSGLLGLVAVGRRKTNV